MAKMRVYELAKELDVQSKEIITFLAGKKIEVKSASSNVEDDAIDLVKKEFAKGSEAGKQEKAKKATPKAPDKTPAKEKEQPTEKKAEDKPKKKKNISVVMNTQYSSNMRRRPEGRPQQGGEGRPDRSRGDGKKSAFRPEAGHTIIRPRENAGRMRPGSERENRPTMEELRAPQKPIARETAKPAAQKPKTAPTAPKEEPAVVAEAAAAPKRPERQNIFENKRPAEQPPAEGQKKPGGRDGGRKKKQERGSEPKNKERIINLEKTSGHKKKQAKPQAPQRGEDEILTLVLPERMTIRELADKMKEQPSAVVKKLFMQGMMVTVNQEIDYAQAEEIALEFNCVCEPEEKVDVIAELLKEEEENEKDMVTRPPVVCVMGHVDHGKTSLLDAIRNTHMTDREAGGITQKIGAYVVSINGQKITFLDTPGHEAFTAMRMRGANSTDIAILVVAADDGVMPQTVEAINHAKAAGIEIIVAINKIDKEGANIDRVKKELSEHELVSEDWGGSTVFVPVSAKSGEGIDELLEMILLTAEVLELKANPKRNARGIVIEAELDKGRGVVATVLVQKGTLRVGDAVAAGQSFGKVRAMIDEHDRRLKKAGPSTPVEILGLSEVPNAGEIFLAMDNDKEARDFAQTFVSVGKDKLIEDTKSKMSLDDLFSQIQSGNLKELNVIVKADVQGSVEAVKQSLSQLSNDEVVIKIIHSGVGTISESDVTLANASNAIIIGFNVKVDTVAKQSAESEDIDIRLYSVIYNIIEDVEAAMKGMLEPIYEEKIIGHAQVRQVFKSSDVGNIAGSYVTDGEFVRDCKVRVMRGGEQIFEGNLGSLKRFKDNVKEVKSGFECGLVIEDFPSVEVDDEIEAYIMVEVPR